MTSLTCLIADFRAGVAKFNANAGGSEEEMDAYADITFRPALEAIRAFDGAATSHAEAMLALEMAEDELRDGDHETAAALINAARLYLREVTPCN